ncbi:MAG TPA: Holliday junction branch migration protein RuvA [Alphaproteobacteria bacterium]|nr:Holliday junction branch migration protein RuvA [Alphaproteobacteria bacterium]USO06256.1 MAG: Holliday junction branch migration protein RuvA [Rhodospirillales bacterium]HOO81460.1 Holliday junction branch migration protein RuvA [Alphaproteobacteria bacterium]
MIGKLSGIIDSFSSGHLILDVGGVGYLVHASARTLEKIGQKGDPASLLIETAVREDAITLYGFVDSAEQSWFKLLTSVQGVGAKAGLAILSALTPEKISLAIAAQDKAMLTQADGVGPKLATRILTELKDKAVNLDLSPKSVEGFVDNSEKTPEGVDNDAVSALINLGYARADAYSAVIRAKDKANDNLQDLIRLALKELSA